MCENVWKCVKIWKLNVWQDSFIYVAWIIDDITHPCMWHDSFICVIWLINMCDIWPIHICVTWLIHICSLNYWWHDWFTSGMPLEGGHVQFSSHFKKENFFVLKNEKTNLKILVENKNVNTYVAWLLWHALIWGAYGVATTSRLLKITGLFCKRAL